MHSFTSTPDPGFTPRKEFIREQRTTANVFSLLALSGSSCVRLFAFPLPIVVALRRFFDQASLTIAFRENVSLNLCEFVLDGKPWARPKSAISEQLLIDILSIVYQHGYVFLSTLDYGRERDDRVAIAFSKPCILPGSSIRSVSPVPSSPQQGGSGSTTSHQPSAKRIAFALSFASATLLRVISPPLHCTPAILQAIRSSWPRGVVSEKKVAEASYEFKLKGYRWFQEDTFATDSLQHILSILSSLDAHSFSLLTSLSLTSRSRVKDLWIFMGPASLGDQEVASPDPPSPSTLNSPPGEFKRIHGISLEPQSGPGSHHRRFATAPASPHAKPPATEVHGRVATENTLVHGSIFNKNSPTPYISQVGVTPAGFHKSAPRAQVPVSVTRDFDEREGFRVTLPSTISSDVENMTGVGAAASHFSRRIELGRHNEVIYETSAETEGVGERSSPIAPEPTAAFARPRSRSPPGRQRQLRPVSSRSKTPPLLKSNGSPIFSSGHSPVTPHTQSPPRHGRSNSTGSIPLLNPGVFRDSAFSSGTEVSTEIPIKWVGGDKGEREERRDMPKGKTKSSPEPTFPGGWAATPVEEPENVGTRAVGANQGENHQPIQQVSSRVALPEVMHPHEGARKSETGSVGVIPPPSPPLPQGKGKGKDVQSETSTQGWVLVNVEGKRPSTSGALDSSRQGFRSPEPLIPPSPLRTPNGSPSVNKDPKNLCEERATAAKAIVMVDAMDAKSPKPRTDGSNLSLRRILRFKKKSETEEETMKRKSRARLRTKMNMYN